MHPQPRPFNLQLFLDFRAIFFPEWTLIFFPFPPGEAFPHSKMNVDFHFTNQKLGFLNFSEYLARY